MAGQRIAFRAGQRIAFWARERIALGGRQWIAPRNGPGIRCLSLRETVTHDECINNHSDTSFKMFREMMRVAGQLGKGWA